MIVLLTSCISSSGHTGHQASPKPGICHRRMGAHIGDGTLVSVRAVSGGRCLGLPSLWNRCPRQFEFVEGLGRPWAQAGIAGCLKILRMFDTWRRDRIVAASGLSDESLSEGYYTRKEAVSRHKQNIVVARRCTNKLLISWPATIHHLLTSGSC